LHLGYAVISQKNLIHLPDSVMKKLDIDKDGCLEFLNSEGNIIIKKVVPRT